MSEPRDVIRVMVRLHMSLLPLSMREWLHVQLSGYGIPIKHHTGYRTTYKYVYIDQTAPILISGLGV